MHDSGGSAKGGWAIAVPVGGSDTLHRVVDDNAVTAFCVVTVSMLVVFAVTGGERRLNVKRKLF